MINFTNILKYQNICMPNYTPQKIYFEFGVANNNLLIRYIRSVQQFCQQTNTPISDFKIYCISKIQSTNNV